MSKSLRLLLWAHSCLVVLPPLVGAQEATVRGVGHGGVVATNSPIGFVSTNSPTDVPVCSGSSSGKGKKGGKGGLRIACDLFRERKYSASSVEGVAGGDR